MEQLEALRQWLAGCPELGEEALQVDELGKTAPCAALCPEGITELWRREDILGGWKARYRLRIKLLARVLRAAGTDGTAQAQSWLDVQTWVRENPAPALGDDQQTRLEKGKLKSADGDGTAVYEAVLTVEYTLPTN